MLCTGVVLRIKLKYMKLIYIRATMLPKTTALPSILKQEQGEKIAPCIFKLNNTQAIEEYLNGQKIIYKEENALKQPSVEFQEPRKKRKLEWRQRGLPCATMCNSPQLSPQPTWKSMTHRFLQAASTTRRILFFLSATPTSNLTHLDKPTMENKEMIICWFYNDKSPFHVDICPEKTISHLKEAILAKEPSI
jgi:hypothetical protein